MTALAQSKAEGLHVVSAATQSPYIAIHLRDIGTDLKDGWHFYTSLPKTLSQKCSFATLTRPRIATVLAQSIIFSYACLVYM